MTRYVKSFKDSEGTKGQIGDQVVNLKTMEVYTVQNISLHGSYGAELHSKDLMNKELMFQSKISKIIKRRDK